MFKSKLCLEITVKHVLCVVLFWWDDAARDTQLLAAAAAATTSATNGNTTTHGCKILVDALWTTAAAISVIAISTRLA